MKDMTTFAPYEWAIIAWYLTCGAAAFVGYAAYATNITFAISLIVIRVSSVPLPLSDSVPCLDLDLHQLPN